MRICAIPGCEKAVYRRDTDTCSYQHGYTLRSLNQQRQKDGLPALVASGAWSEVERPPKPEPPQKEVLSVEEEHRLRKEVKRLAKELADALDTKAANGDYETFVSQVVAAGARKSDRKWLKRKADKGKVGILESTLSDIHYEERVDPAVMNWVNGYDPDIADKRIENFFVNLASTAFDTLKGIRIDGLVLNAAGDWITGYIHEELRQTNWLTPLEACVRVCAAIKTGLKFAADEFGHVLMPCVIGNHGRMTDKMPHKYPVKSSFDWLIYAMLQVAFADDPRIELVVPDSIDCFYRVYDHAFALEHGNAFKGGSNAISGIYPSISLGNYRKRNAEQAVGNAFDYLVIGDKHQLKYLGHTFINGSVIGYNEYARDSKFGFEKPQQMFFVVDPEHGPTIKGEIFVQAKDEPWMAERDRRRNARVA